MFRLHKLWEFRDMVTEYQITRCTLPCGNGPHYTGWFRRKCHYFGEWYFRKL